MIVIRGYIWIYLQMFVLMMNYCFSLHHDNVIFHFRSGMCEIDFTMFHSELIFSFCISGIFEMEIYILKLCLTFLPLQKYEFWRYIPEGHKLENYIYDIYKKLCCILWHLPYGNIFLSNVLLVYWELFGLSKGHHEWNCIEWHPKTSKHLRFLGHICCCTRS